MNVGIIIVVALGIMWALGIFLGAIGGMSKSFKQAPAAIDSTDIKANAEQTIQETEEKRKQMMEDLKQKAEDARQQKY